MSLKIFLVIIFLSLTVSNLGGQQLNLNILKPPDKTKVPERPFVEGTVSDPNANVWVVVHPMAVSDYWVQPKPTVKREGAWRVKVYIGRPGTIDIGEEYEIQAFANPKGNLREGLKLPGWPDADGKSQIIDVTRK